MKVYSLVRETRIIFSQGYLVSYSIRLLVLSAVLAVLVTFYRRSRKPNVTSVHRRGRSLRAELEVAELLQGHRADSDPGFALGQQRLPSPAAYSHVALAGATGSGKTLLHRLLLQSVLPLIGQGFEHRALIYDAKQDLLSLLAGLRLRAPIRTLNPLDARSVGWNLAADIETPAAALQMASTLIPDVKTDNNPFFANAARHLMAGAINALVLHANGRWTFRQLLLMMRDSEKLRTVLDRSDQTRFLLQYFEHPGTFQNILSTVLTALAPFEVIAAAWDRAEEQISLAAWLREESILVLGNDEANRAALEAMNRLIFRRIAEMVLSQTELYEPGFRSPRTWFFLDEVREAGKLDNLSRLLTQGRSKGAAVVLGFQDVAGLQAVYGKEVANELVGQCATTVILRLNSPETAAWASRVIGSHELLESRHSHSRSYPSILHALPGTGASVSHGVATRPLVLESEIMDLPLTSFQTGLSAYVISPWTGVFREHLPGTWLKTQLRSPDRNVANFSPRPVAHQYLRPWGVEDDYLLEDTPVAVAG